jgi:phosphatidylglycerol:prolipoprotein diacylglycerol transferase
MYPDIFISDSVVIPTYIVFLSLLYCFLILYAYRRTLKFKRPMKTSMDLALILMVAGFVGGRLLHVFFEAPFYYKENWLRIFYFWQGGFVFYGGFISAFVCCLLYLYLTRKQKGYKKFSALQWADFYAPVAALGYGLGRISCFLAGCCYGKSCDLPWAVTFPWDMQAVPRHPVQIYMTIWELILFSLLLLMEKKKTKPGQIFFIWLLLHSVGRFAAEQFRDDFRGNFIWTLSLSSWISIGLAVCAGIFLKLKSK